MFLKGTDWCDVFVQQASKLSLHTIDGQPAEELRVFPPAELDAVSDPNVIVDKMSTLEVQCGQIKPNLGAIAEYKKKVRCVWEHDYTPAGVESKLFELSLVVEQKQNIKNQSWCSFYFVNS